MDAKAFQEDLQGLGITPNLAQPQMGKEVGRRRARSKNERVKCREGRGTTEKKSGIGVDERQLEMSRLAARSRRSNLVILVTLKKGNHPDEA